MLEPSRIEKLRALLAKNAEDDLLWFTLGRELAKTQAWAEAVSAFQTAVRLKPDYATAHRELGSAWAALGNIPQAQQSFQKAVEMANQTGDLQVAKEATALAARLSHGIS